jgi:hypothetical protein
MLEHVQHGDAQGILSLLANAEVGRDSHGD